MKRINFQRFLFSFIGILISFSLFAQLKNGEIELTTKIGKINVNELNLGVSFGLKNDRELELLFGYERRTESLFFGRCGGILNLWPRDFPYTRSKIKGVNLRTTYYGLDNQRFGITNLLRYGNANDLTLCTCAIDGPKLTRKFNQEIFDVGLLGTIRTIESKYIKVTASFGFMIRTSDFTNYSEENRSLYNGIRYRDDRRTTTLRLLTEYGMQFSFPIKKMKEVE